MLVFFLYPWTHQSWSSSPSFFHKLYARRPQYISSSSHLNMRKEAGALKGEFSSSPLKQRSKEGAAEAVTSGRRRKRKSDDQVIDLGQK